MNALALDELAASLGLGTASAASLVKPGSRPVWRVDTELGAFHVKQWHQPVGEWLAAMLAGCAEVELSAAAVDIEMPEPIALLHPLSGDLFTVHEWIDGRELTSDDDAAGWLGAVLAQLHALPAPISSPPDALVAAYGVHPSDEWDVWIAQGRAAGRPWARLAAMSMPVIEDATELVRGALAGHERVVGSHRDLPGHNVMVRRDGSFALVDWEYAGPQLAWPEAVWAAIDLGRLAAGTGLDKAERADPSVVRTVLDAYVAAGGIRDSTETGLAAVFGTSLARIAWWMWVSLGHRDATVLEQRAATDAIAPALENLTTRFGRRSELARLVAP